MRTAGGAGAGEEHVAYLAALRLKKRRIKRGRSRAKIEAKNNRHRKKKGGGGEEAVCRGKVCVVGRGR